ncbi:hypothetical protein [Endozoicomonas atrinae]|uniref:hypothetical protein n=1 Tax=Endozoicomonas atrinae TaxID=1333660 RepID=UPI0008271EB3|nr:hypothetical protein [Endozoicomonas atrinae]
MNLDDKCSVHFNYRSFIECGVTYQRSNLSNLPLEKDTWEALSALAQELLDPIVEYFGDIELTYGFCSEELAKARQRLTKKNNQLAAIFPSLDQHACHELNQKMERICCRGGAACDFFIPGKSSLDVSLWIAQNLPFDRLYYYASDRPVHVSYNRSDASGQVSIMRQKKTGRGYIPFTTSVAGFLERFANES